MSDFIRIFAAITEYGGTTMIKFYETREEMLEAFKKSVALRKVWEDLTSGRMTFEDFKKQGYNTVTTVE
jgi:hypothetical protein